MKKHTSLALLTFLVMLAGACSKDAPVDSRTDSASITVNIASRQQEDIDNKEVKDNEGIKTLRLIMVQEGKVAGNWVREYNDNSLQQTFRIMGVKVVNTDFYAIVNEKGVNFDYAQKFPIGASFDYTAYSGAALVEPNVATNRIPMEGRQSVQATAMANGASISIPVTRALARIDLTVNNLTGSELQINQINFGSFFPVAGYLLDRTGLSVLNQPKDFTENQTLAANEPGKSHTFTYYLFEPSGGTYTVGMKGSTNYELTPIYDKETGRPVASIERNQLLKIAANAKLTGWELNCKVAPWDLKEHEIEFSDNLSYTSHGWTPGTIAGRQNHVVELNPETWGELKFVVQSPSGATRWVATIGDDANFELEAKEGSPLFDEKGTPKEQVLRVKVKSTASEHAETMLHVYAVVGSGAFYELDLTDAKGTANTNHFTLKRAGGK